jgi:hypothetical protein
MNKIRFILIIGVTILLMLIYGLFDPTQTIFPKCIFKMLTGLHCPGCGSQRAVHQLLQGNFSQAFFFNPLLMPALLYALLGMVLPILFPLRWQELKRMFFGVKATYISLTIIILFFIGRNLL